MKLEVHIELEDKMTKTISVLKEELSVIRAGRANPAMLDKISVDYYGSQTPLKQMAGISSPDPRTIVIQPWDKTALKEIEKAILASDLGFNPSNDGEVIRINIPQLTEERRKELKYKVGTMIEVPRAVVLSKEIGEKAEFFSYGTNDLTQMTFGMSRDDSSKFLDDYLNNNVLTEDPFKHIDEKGVGQLIILSKELGRRANPNLELGICGEHGGDPQSIEFFNKIGLDYVSCSPYRIPIAKLAAAQAVVKSK